MKLIKPIPAGALGVSLLIIGVLTIPLARAHLGVDEQIQVLGKLIEAKPGDASLYLRRGELHRIHRDWSNAEKDYLHARKLDPDLVTVDFCMGRMNLDAGNPAEAKKFLDLFLQKRPNDPKGREIRGRALAALGKHLAAAEDFSVALAHAGEGTPRPEIYLERARALMAAGPQNVDRALSGLEEGLEALGKPITLELYALDLEIGAKRYDAALRRLDQLSVGSVRKEPWLMRKGAVLEAAGRGPEAMQAYQQALSAIETLPSARRRTKAVHRLESEAQAALERLDDAETSEP